MKNIFILSVMISTVTCAAQNERHLNEFFKQNNPDSIQQGLKSLEPKLSTNDKKSLLEKFAQFGHIFVD
jgi:hypothetical protein